MLSMKKNISQIFFIEEKQRLEKKAYYASLIEVPPPRH